MRRIIIFKLLILFVVALNAQQVKKLHFNLKKGEKKDEVILHIENYLQDVGYGLNSEMNQIETDSIVVDTIKVALSKFLWIFPRDPDTVSVQMKHEFVVDFNESSKNKVQIKSFVCISEEEEIYKKKIINSGQKYASNLRKKIKDYLDQKN